MQLLLSPSQDVYGPHMTKDSKSIDEGGGRNSSRQAANFREREEMRENQRGVGNDEALPWHKDAVKDSD